MAETSKEWIAFNLATSKGIHGHDGGVESDPTEIDEVSVESGIKDTFMEQDNDSDTKHQEVNQESNSSKEGKFSL